jgi:hypothetical protein
MAFHMCICYVYMHIFDRKYKVSGLENRLLCEYLWIIFLSLSYLLEI